MTDKTYNVLFVCTGNSVRSVMAECLLNQLGAGRFKGFSAGSMPRGEVNPQALKTLEHLGVAHEGVRSKSWAEFARPDAPVLDFIFTVCDNAAGEVCPTWPGLPVTAHWGVADPGDMVASDQEEMDRHFRDAAFTLKRRIELLMVLPLHSLDKLSLHAHVQEIGKQ